MKYLMLIMLLSTTNSWAYDHHRPRPQQNDPACIVTDTDVIKEVKTLQDKCELLNPLELKSGVFNYPLMPETPLRVNYWDAKFGRKIKQETWYEINYYNVCTGKTTLSKTKKYEDVYYKYFIVQNPNLAPNIDKSYLTAAMTKKEAEAAFLEAERECQTYTKE